MHKTRVYLEKNTLNTIQVFHARMKETDSDKWKEEIGDYWCNRIRDLLFTFNYNKHRCYMEIVTDNAFAVPLRQEFVSKIVEYLNTRFALCLLDHISLIQDFKENKILKKLVRLSIPHKRNSKFTEFGLKIKGRYLNQRFIRSIYSVYILLLTTFLNDCSIPDDAVVVEIGAGVGSLGVVMKELFPKSTYVVVDLPDTLIMSTMYLSSIYPEAKILYYPENPVCKKEMSQYDFVFVPHWAICNIPDNSCHLVWNESSFGEMTRPIVNAYFQQLRRLVNCDGLFYNSNRYKKKVDFKDYPYVLSDQHLYKGYDDFQRLQRRIFYRKTKGKTKLKIWNVAYYMVMVWISRLDKLNVGQKVDVNK